MSYTTNILAFPLILIVWALDMYLLIMLIRMTAGIFNDDRVNQLRLRLKPFADPVPLAVGRWLNRHTVKSIKPAVPWLIVVALGLLVRHLIVLAIIAIERA